jgi:trimethylamine---corrinoid protein Co-methyltransferase
MIYGLGMLEMGMTFSYNQLVIDDEIAAMVKRVVSGVKLDDERMGVGLIKKVGIGGNFLTQRHSLDYVRSEQVDSKLMDRRMRGTWKKRGAKDLPQSARERVQAILETHEPPPLPDGAAETFEQIIASAEKE